MKDKVVFSILGLLIGLTVGFFAANTINRNASPAAAQTASAQPNTAQMNEHTTENASGAAMPDIAQKLDKAKNEPQNFAAQMQAGDMYYQIGRFDKAIEYYENGVKLNPNDFQTNVVLANSYFDSKQFENAEKYYAKALEINPKDINARTDLATTFVERANPDLDRAIKEFQTALTENPKHEPTLYNLGIAYLKKGDKENAKKTLSSLEQANPNSDLKEKLKKAIAQ